jgi:hypothetical protein
MKPGLNRRENRLRSRGALQLLEPDDGKLSRPVLRGGSGGNAALLPDKVYLRSQRSFTVMFIAKTGTNFVQWVAQLFGIQKTNLPRHGTAMRWEVGVIKLTAKPASVLANKPQ